MAVILILAAIAIPNFLRSRLAANEASAVGSLHAINNAEVTYNTTYPSQGYACSLLVLGPPASGTSASSSTASLIDANLAGGVESGYDFTELSSDCKAASGINMTYDFGAVPVTPGITGQRYLAATLPA